MWQIAALIGAGLALFKNNSFAAEAPTLPVQPWSARFSEKEGMDDWAMRQKGYQSIRYQNNYDAEGINSKLCVLCKKHYGRYGHNAQPLADGRCCDDCNEKVIAARMAMMFGADSVVNHKRGKVISMRGSDPRLRTLRKDKDISPKEARDRLEISAESELFKDEYHDDENKCDRCGSERISYEDIGHHMYQYGCRDCDYKWIEEYEIDYLDYNNAESELFKDEYHEDDDKCNRCGSSRIWKEDMGHYMYAYECSDCDYTWSEHYEPDYPEPDFYAENWAFNFPEPVEISYDDARNFLSLMKGRVEGANEEGYFPADSEDFKEFVLQTMEDEFDIEFDAETFNAAVLHKKPKGYVGKAVAMDALMTQARIEEAMLKLETAVKLGLISEDEIMEKLQQQFGSEAYAGNYMVPADIKSLARSVKVLQSKARADQNQPEWWKSKLSVVAAELDDLTDFSDYAEDTGML